MNTRFAFISLSHSAQLKKIASEREVKTMEFIVLESMKEVLTQKNANVGKMIFEPEECLHKKEVENEILTSAEKRSASKLKTPLLLRRHAFRIILRMLERKIKKQNKASSVSNLLDYVNRLSFISSSEKYALV